MLARQTCKSFHYLQQIGVCCIIPYNRSQEPMGCRPDVDLLMTASGSLDIF